jgi:adenylate kinase family enzyme
VPGRGVPCRIRQRLPGIGSDRSSRLRVVPGAADLVRHHELVSERRLRNPRSEVGEVLGATSVGRRVVVTGLAGAGKSTFARALSARTGLPVITLDLHFWKPGWKEPTEDEWRDKQTGLLAGDDWIADGNYPATLDLRLERADTVVILDTAWWICAWRAVVRGVRRRPVGFELPKGCDESGWHRLRDEWCLAWRIWRVRRSERERELEILSAHRGHLALCVLCSKGAVREFLDT